MNPDVFAGLKIVTPPTVEPLSLADVNAFLRLQPVGIDTDADNYITAIITSVRKYIETTVLKRALLTQTWKLFLRTWPGRDYVNLQHYSGNMNEYIKYNHIKIPLPPLQSISSISYITSAGVTLSVTPYDPPVSTLTQQAVNVFKDVEPAQIVLPFSGIWPTDILMPGVPITITFVCGYQLLTDTSPPSGMTILSNWEGFGPTIQAMRLIIADCWENRIPSAEVEKSEMMVVAEKWLSGYRVYE